MKRIIYFLTNYLSHLFKLISDMLMILSFYSKIQTDKQIFKVKSLHKINKPIQYALESHLNNK